MSVADLTSITGGGRADLDRTPPQDIMAEQCVLGGMLLSKDAIADVVEVIRPVDFYRPVHQTIFDAIIDLYGKGEPADPVTIAAELTRTGQLERIGGGPYLHTLVASVPTAANAGYYAEIVRERAILRRLVEAGTKVVQLGYGAAAGTGADVDDVVDRAQAAVYEVVDRRTSEDYIGLEAAMWQTYNEIEAIGNRSGEMHGVPTGFRDLDELTNGLQGGQLIVVAGRPGLGKALALDTRLPTPTGWTTMGAVKVGDQLIGADGRPTTVLAATEVMLGRVCYEVHFDDGTVIIADDEHQWLTHSERSPQSAVRTTGQVAATVWDPSHQPRHSVLVTDALDLPEVSLPISPYALGVWLTARTMDVNLQMLVEAEPPIATADLAGLDVLARPHIPTPYLRASVRQRRELLAGVLDGAGEVLGDGSIVVTGSPGWLADDIYELVIGLGYRCTRTESHGGFPRFLTDDEVFRLEAKRLKHKEHAAAAHVATARAISKVLPTNSVPVKCVQVDNAEQMYLAGESMIPTHNSTLGMDFLRSASISNNMASVLFSLEMGKSEITMRLLSAEARIPLTRIRTGTLTDDDWTKLARRMGEVASAPMFIDDSPNMNMMEIRAKARRLSQRDGLRLIVVDYLQLMTSPKKVENRQQEVAEMSRSLKLLAKELEVPVVAISQLNRGAEQRSDKKPQLSDLRECLTGDTLITRADTGEQVPIRDLVAERNVPVWSLDEHLQIQQSLMTEVWSTGVKPVYRLTLASGHEVTATANHPFLTVEGWKRVEELDTGSALAVARRLPEPTEPSSWPDHEIVMLAHLLGDGCVTRDPIYYCSRDEANLEAVEKAARDFGVGTRRTAGKGVTYLHFPTVGPTGRGHTNPVYDWLRRLNVMGLPAWEKSVPSEVFSLPRAQVKLFLRHLWATDGSVTVSASGRVRIYYGTTSRRLADDVQTLLLRFGIGARLRRTTAPTSASHHQGWTVDVSGRDDMTAFLLFIGVHGERGERCHDALDVLVPQDGNPNVDVIPATVWDYIRSVLRARGISYQGLAGQLGVTAVNLTTFTRGVSQRRMRRLAEVLGDDRLRDLAESEVRWERIVSVESAGTEEVFDAHVPGTHSFLANRTIGHNSGAIEQDADMVILLHREDAYERESPRAGEADLIVAKHRNGPTKDVVVSSQLHYSRFVDMPHA